MRYYTTVGEVTVLRYYTLKLTGEGKEEEENEPEQRDMGSVYLSGREILRQPYIERNIFYDLVLIQCVSKLIR
jgi:hypothetical protein